MEATQGALIRLESWSEYWCLPSSTSFVRPRSTFVSRSYAVSLLPDGAPLKMHSLFCIKLFFGPFLILPHPDGFLYLALRNLPNLNAFTERLVATSPTDSRPPLSNFSSLRRLHLLCKSPGLISPCHLMSKPFVSHHPFPFRVWPDLE